MAYLLVNIDTEEEGLWSGTLPTSNWKLDHLAELPRMQSIFDRYGVRPSYQLTSPVINDPRGGDLLQHLFAEGRCDIGAHPHPWSTEPIACPADGGHSMPCQLPLELVRRQLDTITQEIQDRFDVQPVTYRSGRYGSAAEHTPLLVELGYRIETSVCPLVTHAGHGGPDYFDAPFAAYWLGDRSMVEPQATGELLSVPISAGFNIRWFEWARRLHGVLSRPPFSRLHAIGTLYQLGLLRLARLNPELSSLSEMKALCQAMARRDADVYHLTFHSSDIGVGGTPYVPTRKARDEFLLRLEGILDFMIHELRARPVTSREYYEVYRRAHGPLAETTGNCELRSVKSTETHEVAAMVSP
jgi:hypothetical protein